VTFDRPKGLIGLDQKGAGPGAGAQRSPAADDVLPAERHDLTRSGTGAERGKPVAPPARESEPQGEPTGRRAEGGGASERRPVTGRIGVEPKGDRTPRRKPADFPRALAPGKPWSTASGGKADLSAGRKGLSGCGPHESGGHSPGRLGVGPKGVPCRDGAAVPRAARRRRASAALSVGGATAARVRCPGLEPDEGKRSRPVPRGRGRSNAPLLPDQQTGHAIHGNSEFNGPSRVSRLLSIGRSASLRASPLIGHTGGIFGYWQSRCDRARVNSNSFGRYPGRITLSRDKLRRLCPELRTLSEPPIWRSTFMEAPQNANWPPTNSPFSMLLTEQPILSVGQLRELPVPFDSPLSVPVGSSERPGLRTQKARRWWQFWKT
jgi:hypothetical protein